MSAPIFRDELADALQRMLDVETFNVTVTDIGRNSQNFRSFYQRQMLSCGMPRKSHTTSALNIMIERLGCESFHDLMYVAVQELNWLSKHCPGFILLRSQHLPISALRLAVNHWRVQWLKSLAAEFSQN